jgi:hypothetical protein
MASPKLREIGIASCTVGTVTGVELRFLYVGSDDTGTDLARWLAVPGAVLRWRFHAFDADVAAVDLGHTPLVLIADHRPAGSVLPIYAVADLDASVEELQAAGWDLVDHHAGTPEGPTSVLRSDVGAAIALLRVDRPGAMDAAFTDDENTHAVHSDS